MTQHPARLYTAVAGIFLLLQGSSTLAFRLYSPLDQAFPALLNITQMDPSHSMLHILTGILALVALNVRGEFGPFWFAAGFGVFYVGLALVGMMTHHSTMFGLQAFDHPFHLLLGGLGLLTVGLHLYRSHRGKKTSL